MNDSTRRSRWRNPITIVELLAVLAIVIAIVVVVLKTGLLAGNREPDQAAAPLAPAPTRSVTTAVRTPAPARTATGPETCLAFETGAQECQPGLTWSSHICWAKSSGATLQMKTPSGAWTNIAVADVVRTSDYCSEEYPVEVSIEYTETEPGTYSYRFFNHQTKNSQGAAGDVYTVTVTRP